jgi:hypothetical protein
MLSHQFNPTALREYDIRGIVGKTLGEDDAYAIGRGFGTLVAAAAAPGRGRPRRARQLAGDGAAWSAASTRAASTSSASASGRRRCSIMPKARSTSAAAS